MWADAACRALHNGKRLELRYDGFTRVVEVHTVGALKSGAGKMSVFQVRGGSQSTSRSGGSS